MNVTPIGNGSQSVQQFYDYRNVETNPSANQYASYGTGQYQKDQVSTVFLYHGTNGTSLVFLHDKLDANDTSGSTITMNVTGLPSSGSWAVKDDWYEDGHQDDNWGQWGISSSSQWQGEWGTTSAGPNEIDWMWGPGRSDGGAYTGLQTMNANDSVEVSPGFNANARYWGKWPFSRNESSRMKRWRLMSSGGKNYSLDMNQSITIQSGSCATRGSRSGSTTGANNTSSSSGNQTGSGANNSTSNQNVSGNATSASTTPNGTSGASNATPTSSPASNATSTSNSTAAANGSGGGGKNTSGVTWTNVPGFTVASALVALVVAGALLARRR